MDETYMLLLVRWLDAYGAAPSWEDVSDMRHRSLLCQSVGWCVHADGHNVVLVPHLTAGEGDEQGCGHLIIPARCVLSAVSLVTGGRVDLHAMQRTDDQ